MQVRAILFIFIDVLCGCIRQRYRKLGKKHEKKFSK